MNVQNVKTPLGMLLEECAELISAINRWQRGDTDSVSVMEEIADVEIMLEQMKITFDRETIESIKSQKLAKLQWKVSTMEPVIDSETHKQRHRELHKAIDELLADFITNANGRAGMEIFALIEWSYKQTKEPDHIGCP